MPIVRTLKNVTVAHLGVTDNSKSILIHEGPRDHRWTECSFIHVQASQEGECPMMGSKNAPPGSVAMSLILLGAAIGAAIPPGEHWNEIPAVRYRVGFAPRLDHGLNVAIAGQF
jgi:hypothetical protein